MGDTPRTDIPLEAGLFTMKNVAGMTACDVFTYSIGATGFEPAPLELPSN